METDDLHELRGPAGWSRLPTRRALPRLLLLLSLLLGVAPIACSSERAAGPIIEPGAPRPGHGRKVSGAHPGLEIASIHPPGMKLEVGGLGVLPDGRLAVATFRAGTVLPPDPTPEPNGELFLVDNVTDDDLSGVTATVIADGLEEPLGVAVVGEDIYVSQRSEVTRFALDAATGAWNRTTVAGGWESRDYHTFSFGLIHEPGESGHPGFLYMARSTGLGAFNNPPDHGSVWKIDLGQPSGSNVEALTGGHRTPNGIGFGPEGEVFVSDNQGEWTPANELNHVQKGHFYGFEQDTDEHGSCPTPYQDPADRLSAGRGETFPAIQLPQDEVANSPTQPILIPEGQPYAGQMLMGDMRYGGIQRLALEKVNGVWQGVVFRYTMGLEAGVNRLTWGADGSLYAGGIGGQHAGSWSWINPAGERTYEGLQRLRPTGVAAFEMRTIRATSDGVEIEFTKPVPWAYLAQPGNYHLRHWAYRTTPAYGGVKLGQALLTVTQAVPSDDRMSVRLTVPELETGRVVYVMTDPVSDHGEHMWTTEGWFTLHQIPATSGE